MKILLGLLTLWLSLISYGMWNLADHSLQHHHELNIQHNINRIQDEIMKTLGEMVLDHDHPQGQKVCL